jgi:redox-sensitive bicupin YhaK (pirin superfamily)
MIQIRKSDQRGHFDHGWLDTRHTFSFADYHDPQQMGFGSLRVINEDQVVPGRGFGTHGHRDMEILSYVLSGALQHRDSLGTGSIIRPGELQRMTAGSGVRHSEQNASSSEPVHFLQIWILPEADGLAPGYEQKSFPAEARRGRLQLVASRDGRDGSVTVHQDVALHLANLGAGETARLPLAPGRRAWVQLASGALEVNGQLLQAGDGAALTGEAAVELRGAAGRGGEALLFDLE